MYFFSKEAHHKLKMLDSAFDQSKVRPSNLHDWGSESAIDPINPLVYIQARHLQSEVLFRRSME
jgi:hypothetical protein